MNPSYTASVVATSTFLPTREAAWLLRKAVCNWSAAVSLLPRDWFMFCSCSRELNCAIWLMNWVLSMGLSGS